MLDHLSVKFLYAKIHLITKFILVILSFLLYYYIFSTYVSSANIDYCCQGSIACIFVCFSFLYNIVIIGKKNYLSNLIFTAPSFTKTSLELIEQVVGFNDIIETVSKNAIQKFNVRLMG